MRKALFVAALVVTLTTQAQQVQNVQRVRPVSTVPTTPVTATPDAGAASLAKDYQALYQKEVEKNRALRAEVETLTSRIAAMTRPGGSLVRAYCESPTVSRNTAGASNDCATTGFGCEPVSGLCRTSARSSDECAVGFTYCSIRANCVRTAAECQ